MTGQVITTAAELDTLPVGSVVRDRDGDEWTLTGRRPVWRSPETRDFPADTIVKKWGPLTVLYRPDAATEPASTLQGGGDAATPVAPSETDRMVAQARVEWADADEAGQRYWALTWAEPLMDALAAARGGEAEGDGSWTALDWQEWSNEVASAMPENFDGDEGQEDIILRFVQYAAEHLRTCPVWATDAEGAGEAVDPDDVSAEQLEAAAIAGLDATSPTWRATGHEPSADDLTFLRAALGSLGIRVVP